MNCNNDCNQGRDCDCTDKRPLDRDDIISIALLGLATWCLLLSFYYLVS